MSIKYKRNPVTGQVDLVDVAPADTFKGLLGAEPTTATEGDTYVNVVDHNYYIYYGGTWQALHTLTPAALEFLELESGDILLLESGDKLALEP